MNKLVVKFEIKINEKTGLFFLDSQTSTSEAKEMMFAFLKYLGQVEDNAKAQVPPEPALEQPQEVVHVE